LNSLGGASEAVGRYLAGWERHVGDLTSRLKDVRHLFLVGRGASLAAAATGGLITKESAHFHAEGMSSAAFRHGPFEMLTADTMVVILEGEAPTIELNRRLADDVHRTGAMSVLVTQDETPDPFHLPPSAAAVRPILEILPVEMMTVALAELRGREAGAFELASKVTSVE
jgi:glucosamine--fructose-6-phosphate aminotransferase (isomerizing)